MRIAQQMALNPMPSLGHRMQTKILAHEKIQMILYAGIEPL
jgi:uncharacterized protein YoaH (UPF0181 family)